MAESIRLTLVALFFFWMSQKGLLVDEMSFEALLAAAIVAILLRLPGRSFVIVQSTTYPRIACLRTLNFRSRKLPSAPKSAPKLLLSFCYRSALVLLSFHKSFF